VKIKRRDFLKLTAAAASSSIIAGDALASEHAGPESFNNAIGVLVDTTFCIGCRKCEWACNQSNKLPTRDIKVFDDKLVFLNHRRPTNEAYTIVNTFHDPKQQGKDYYMKLQCMHCNRPACVSACIVGALKKTELGPVTYDAWKCMGCRYCMIACPFQIPAYEYNNALTPQVRKCTFCFTRLTAENKKPACVEICPNEALTFGSRGDLLALAHGRIKQSPERYTDHIYGQNEVGGTSWMYLASPDFSATELPALDSRPIPEATESIQHGVFKSFVPPLALYGLLALAMNSFKNRGKGDGHERS
jgi:formate dehydrogenase iron-sulfur subunit